MFAVAGATGRVGSATANRLLSDGAEVRVLVRNRSAAQAWERRGAQARVVSLEDRDHLSAAIEGCASVFALLPFDLSVSDIEAHTSALISSIAGAIADARTEHVVMLSSGGADLAEATGPIVGLHQMEQALEATGAIVTALRASHFQEKVTDIVDVARGYGIYPVFADTADQPLPMVATADIGEIAAHALRSRPSAGEAVDIIGPSSTERDVADLLGHLLGEDLRIETYPAHARVAVLVESGFGPHAARMLAELYAADEQGLLAPRGDRKVLARTRIETTLPRLLRSSLTSDSGDARD